MIFLVWMTAVIVSLAPLFGWKDADFNFRSMKRSSKSNGILQENQLKTTAFTTEASGDMNIPSGRSSNNGAVSICSDITEVAPKNEISPTSEKNYPQSESYSQPENNI
ncbi:hypothetical protein Anas_05472 [Armadillidium nasatum]|uniref:Uncharacterized protein n=1 Tax=Armadillidium nasatum TaxID=96803 RepID=A0A5N5TJX1_9CRUS|nr:hypothetical protein Anas_05472 [Armadillidium nasatum]